MAISSKLDQDVIDRSVNNAAAVINARIDGMALAVEVFQADLHRVPTAMDRAVLSLRELLESKLSNVDRQVEQYHDISRGKIEQLAAVMGERFTGVAAQFSERDTRTDQRAGDTKLAVDAAFAAAKEATAKIEAGFTKQIEIDADDPNAYRNRGAAYASKHDNNSALADYTKAIDVTRRRIESGDRRLQ